MVKELRANIDNQQLDASITKALPDLADVTVRMDFPSVRGMLMDLLECNKHFPPPVDATDTVIRILGLVSTAFNVGFQTGRIYQDEEHRNVRPKVEIVQ